MTEAQTARVQRALNTFTDRYLAYVTPLRADGELGQATKKRIRVVKYYLGYPAKERDSIAGERFRHRLHHPKRLWASNPIWQARGAKRRIRQRRVATAEHKKLAALAQRHPKGFAIFEGRVVAAWMVSRFEWAKTHKVNGRVWVGTVISGVRTADHSEHLCFGICGRPSCPGTCAGRSSNHNMEPSQGEPHGAADVTDYMHFDDAMRECPLEPKLRNDLPNDRPHFSATGR